MLLPSITACAVEAQPPETATADGPCEESTWYLDRDDDGHGSALSPWEGCAEDVPHGYVESGDDCADGDPALVDACFARGELVRESAILHVPAVDRDISFAALSPGDLTGDGTPDLVAGWSGEEFEDCPGQCVVVIDGHTTGIVDLAGSAVATLSPGGESRPVDGRQFAFADIDQDGNGDLLTVSSWSSFHVALGPIRGRAGDTDIDVEDTSFNDVATAAGADGSPLVVLTQSATEEDPDVYVTVLPKPDLGSGDLSGREHFSWRGDATFGREALDLDAGRDLNGDGIDDAVVVSRATTGSEPSALVMPGPLDRELTFWDEIGNIGPADAATATAVIISDIDGDGRDDLATGHPDEDAYDLASSGCARLWWQIDFYDSSAEWALFCPEEAQAGWGSEVRAEDIDLDGQLDLALAGSGGSIQVFFGPFANASYGEGHAHAHVEPVSPLPVLDLADVTGDEGADILYGDWDGLWLFVGATRADR